ncbi:hypothetical protein L596_013333 [Steinernema carpocapsae]|uniref:Myb-like domain-containing protein n=1 Tax=Steinernema carpocapsae TaxID=34508 RepID=A0A4U5P0P0_STECR|nr:hypothetical protein L596_013333 [Steinernema carpocapsae]
MSHQILTRIAVLAAVYPRAPVDNCLFPASFPLLSLTWTDPIMNGDLKDIMDAKPGTPTLKNREPLALLNLTDTSSKKRSGKKKTLPDLKRPEGMNRELFEILRNHEDGEEHMASFKNKPKVPYVAQNDQIRNRRTRPWTVEGVDIPGRTDGFQMRRWTRSDRREESPFHVQRYEAPKVPSYTDEEFAAHLKTADWPSKEETDYLFKLVIRYSFRWIAIASCWDHTRFPNENRSTEDLKARYSWIHDKLNEVRGRDNVPVGYNLEKQKARKEALEKLHNRTQEQLDEEAMLVKELKKIDAKNVKTKAKKNVVAVKPEPVDINGNEELQASSFKECVNLNDDGFVPILRFSDFSYAHMRSNEMRLVQGNPQRKIVAVEAVEDTLGYAGPHGAFPELVDEFKAFRLQVVELQHLKDRLAKAEAEVKRLEDEAKARGVKIKKDNRKKKSSRMLTEVVISAEKKHQL